MNNSTKEPEHTTVVEDLLDDAQSVVNEAQELIVSAAAPVKRHVFKRFPAAFLLAVTFGVSMTFFGIEQLLSQSLWLSEHPLVSLSIGIVILVATGTLYKKLG